MRGILVSTDRALACKQEMIQFLLSFQWVVVGLDSKDLMLKLIEIVMKRNSKFGSERL